MTGKRISHLKRAQCSFLILLYEPTPYSTCVHKYNWQIEISFHLKQNLTLKIKLSFLQTGILRVISSAAFFSQHLFKSTPIPSFCALLWLSDQISLSFPAAVCTLLQDTPLHSSRCPAHAANISPVQPRSV